MTAALFALLVGGAACLFILGLLRSEALLRVHETMALTIAAILVAVGAPIADGSPTGFRVLDGGYRLALGLLCVYAASRSRRGSNLVGLFVAVAAVAGSWSGGASASNITFAALAAGTAVACAWSKSDSVAFRALTGALIANAVLRFPTSMPNRFPTLLAIAAVSVLSIAAAATRGRERVRFFVVMGAAAGLYGIGLAGGAVGGLSARGDAEAGIRFAREALDAVRNGDVVAATTGLTRAADSLREANRVLEGPETFLGRYLPVVGPNIAAVRALTATGADVARRSAGVVAAVDLLHLRTPDGRIDVTRIAKLQGPLLDTRHAIDRSLTAIQTSDSPWLAPALHRQADRLRSELVRAQRSSADAADVVAVLPDMLGAKGPRRYLVVVPTPAEARGSGGLIGNFGEISAIDGRLRLERFGRTSELLESGVPRAQRTIDAPSDYRRRYSRFEVNQLWQNVNLSPDFPSSAQVMASLYPQSGGTTVDGVISADPFALAGFLRITGPLLVDGWPEAFTPENTPRILLYDFYAQLTESRNDERIDLQRQVAQLAWTRLLGGSMPSPQAFVAALAEPIQRRHLQMWSKRPLEQAFLESTGVSGSVPPLRGDWFSAITNNAGANKIEWYLHRGIRYAADVDLRTGQVEATAIVDMQNDAPAAGVATYLIGNTAIPPAPPGTSIQYLSLYSPFDLVSATFDELPIELERDTELGRNVYSGWIRIPPGGRSRLVARLRGRVTSTAPNAYTLQFGCQPLVNNDSVSVRIRVSGLEAKTATATGLKAVDGEFRADEPLSCRSRYGVTAPTGRS